MSRITEYSPTVGKALVDAMRRTGIYAWACDAIGVDRRIGNYWRERGRKGIEPYASFEAEVLKVKAAKGEEILERVLDDKGGPAMVLERMFPAEFGSTGKSFHEVMQVLLDLVMPLLSLSAQRELIDALSTVERQRAGIGEQRVADTEADRAGAIDTDGELVGATGQHILEPGSE